MSRVKKAEEAVTDFPVFFNFLVGKCDAVKVSFSMLSEEILGGLSEIQVRMIEAGVIILFLGGWEGCCVDLYEGRRSVVLVLGSTRSIGILLIMLWPITPKLVLKRILSSFK